MQVLNDEISNLKKFDAIWSFAHAAAKVRKKKQKLLPQINRDNILVVLVIVSMLGFSVTMLISCHRIICDGESIPKSAQKRP